MTIDSKPLPLTLITGFLGAGKTTLVSSLVKQNPELKFGLIENEFAELNIDALILSESDSENSEQVWIERMEGCLCCQVNGDLAPKLTELIKSSPHPLDHLIIETTGLADPTPLVAQLLQASPLLNLVRLDGVTCLIDGQNFHRQFADREKLKELTLQIGMATQFLISKTLDLSETQKNEITHTLETLNPTAEISFCEAGAIESSIVLNQEAFNLNHSEKNLLATFKKVQNPKKTFSLGGLKLEHEHSAIKSWCLELAGELNPQVFELFLNITMRNSKLLRGKGLLCFKGQPQKVFFQAVYDQFEFSLGNPWSENELKMNQIVLIGEGTESDVLEIWKRGLENSLIKS